MADPRSPDNGNSHTRLERSELKHREELYIGRIRSNWESHYAVKYRRIADLLERLASGTIVVPPSKPDSLALDPLIEAGGVFTPSEINSIDHPHLPSINHVTALWWHTADTEDAFISVGFKLTSGLWHEHSWGNTPDGVVWEGATPGEIYWGVQLDSIGADLFARVYGIDTADDLDADDTWAAHATSPGATPDEEAPSDATGVDVDLSDASADASADAS